MATVDFLYLNNVQIPQILSPLIFMTSILCYFNMSARNISRDPFFILYIVLLLGANTSCVWPLRYRLIVSWTSSELHGSKLKSFSPRQERKTKKMTAHKREKIGIWLWHLNIGLGAIYSCSYLGKMITNGP